MNEQNQGTPAPETQNQPTAQEVTALESFADRLLEEYDSQMYECVAAAANDCETSVVTKEDIKRLGPFIQGMMVRLFALGVGAMAADIAKQAKARSEAQTAATVTLQ